MEMVCDGCGWFYSAAIKGGLEQCFKCKTGWRNFRPATPGEVPPLINLLPIRVSDGLKMIPDRAARADMEAVLAILEKIPDVPPEPGDE